jgi:hypothetical protein
MLPMDALAAGFCVVSLAAISRSSAEKATDWIASGRWLVGLSALS